MTIAHVTLFYVPTLFSFKYNELSKNDASQQVPLHFHVSEYRFADYQVSIKSGFHSNCHTGEYYQFNKDEIEFKSKNDQICAADIYMPLFINI